jgi:hypothetical protein
VDWVAAKGGMLAEKSWRFGFVVRRSRNGGSYADGRVCDRKDSNDNDGESRSAEVSCMVILPLN